MVQNKVARFYGPQCILLYFVSDATLEVFSYFRCKIWRHILAQQPPISYKGDEISRLSATRDLTPERHRQQTRRPFHKLPTQRSYASHSMIIWVQHVVFHPSPTAKESMRPAQDCWICKVAWNYDI